MQPELFDTSRPGAGVVDLTTALTAFYDDLAVQRPLTIIEQAQKTMILQIARPISAHLAYGKLSVADQKALEMINEIIGSVDLATGQDEEIDALTETMKALTSKALTQKGGVDRD